MKKNIWALLIAIMILCLGTCANPGKEVNEVPPGELYLEYRKGKSPMDIAEKFLSAIYNSDLEVAKRYGSGSTENALKTYATRKGPLSENFRIMEVVEDGDYRQVHYVDDFMLSRSNTIQLGKDSQSNWEVQMTTSDLKQLP